MADVKISGLPASTVPLAGTEVLPIVQGGATKQVSIANVTAGRAVSALNLTIPYSSASVSSRSWKVANDVAAYGDFNIQQSTTQTGSTYSTKMYFGPTGGIALNATTDLGAGNLYATTKISIGQTSPSYNLEILGATQSVARLKNPSGGTGSAIYVTASTSSATIYAMGDAASIVGGAADSNAVIYTGTAIPLKYYIAGALTTTMFASGGVSIGNTTDKGAASLNVSGLIYPQQATTAAAPAYVKGAIYFDTTLNKLCVGGATAWETITSV
jgi:hypothetical protein